MNDELCDKALNAELLKTADWFSAKSKRLSQSIPHMIN